MATDLPGILIVDDNEDNRYTLQLMLESDGHERITCAAGGNEAIALIKKEKFSLVLLDFMMPDLNGDEVLKATKSDPDQRGIPVARSDPRPSARVTRGAGSGRHLASVLQEGRENANIDAALGFIWGISVYVSYALADLTRTGLSVPANCLTTAFSQRLSAAADAELMRRTT
jgi:hypothetical protein